MCEYIFFTRIKTNYCARSLKAWQIGSWHDILSGKRGKRIVTMFVKGRGVAN